MLDAKLWSHIQNGGGVSEARGDSQSSIQMRNMWQTARIRKGESDGSGINRKRGIGSQGYDAVQGGATCVLPARSADLGSVKSGF